MLTAFAALQHQPSPSAAAQDASSNADLAQISMTLNERLIPRFDPSTTAYTIRMTQSNVISGYTYIQANPKESDATITVTSGGREYSAPTYTIPVKDFGVAQEVQIKVTAPDGVTTKTYTLTTQPLPTPTPTPIPTATPIPTNTPVPTDTPTPTPTATPDPLPPPLDLLLSFSGDGLELTFTAVANRYYRYELYRISDDGRQSESVESGVASGSPIAFSGLTQGFDYLVQIKTCQDASGNTCGVFTTSNRVQLAHPTATPTHTPTVAPTAVPTATPEPTVAPTAVPVPTSAPTDTPTPAANATATPIPTPSTSATPTAEPTYECLPVQAPASAAKSSSSDLAIRYPNADSFFLELMELSCVATDGTITNCLPVYAISIEPAGNVSHILAFLDAKGLHTSFSWGTVKAYDVPLDVAADVTNLPGVVEVVLYLSRWHGGYHVTSTIVRPQDDAIPTSPPNGDTAESTQSRAANWHGAYTWHDAGYKGQGINVGIIDQGFERLPTVVAEHEAKHGAVSIRCLVAGTPTANSDISECLKGGTTHGAEVAEALLNIAPKANLFIARPEKLNDQESILELMRDNKVAVINQSDSFNAEGPGDGTAAVKGYTALESVATGVRNGAVWVNSAGNQAGVNTFFSSYSDEDDEWMDFALEEVDGVPIDNNRVRMGRGTKRFVVRWKNREGSNNADLDLILCSEPNCPVSSVLRTLKPTTNTDTFKEFIYPSRESQVAYLRICLTTPENRPEWVQLVRPENEGSLHYSSSFGSIGTPGESASPGMLSVGAAKVSGTKTQPTYMPEKTSGRGPAIDGRTKPDLVGAAGEYSSVGSNNIFTGTSSAAPHVAGLAVLIRQRFPNYSPADVVAYLKRHAERRPPEEGDPLFPNLTKTPTPAESINNVWGWGFAKLPPLKTTPTATPLPTASLTLSDSTITVGETVDVTVGMASPSDAEFKLRTVNLSAKPCVVGQRAPDEEYTSNFVSPKTFTFYGCWKGTAKVQLVATDRTALASPTPLSVFTPTHTPVPTATPLPKPSAKLTVTRSGSTVTNIHVGDWVLVRATNIKPAGTKVEFETSHHFHERRCPREGASDQAEPTEADQARASLGDTFYGCSTGNAYIRLIRTADDYEIDRKTIRITDPPTPTPTATNTPVPTATPLPKPSAKLTITRSGSTVSSIHVGDWVLVRATDIKPDGTEVEFDASHHFHERRCPREGASEQTAHVEADQARDTISDVFYGCETGNAHIRLVRTADDYVIESKTIRITHPPTPTPTPTPIPTATPTPKPTATPKPAAVPPPTNLRYSVGTTWINFVWDAPAGYSKFKVSFNRSSSTITRNSYFASRLQRGTPYRFSVRTQADDGRLSSSRSVTVETECGSPGTACAIGAVGTFPTSFGDGIHRIGVQIASGAYVIGSPDNAETCEWERLRNLKGTADQVIESGAWSNGQRVTIKSSDAAFYTSGCGTWTQATE